MTFEGTNTLVNTDATRKQIYIYKADEVEGDADVDRSVTVEGFNEDWSVNNNFNGAVVKSETTLLVNDGETLKSAISCVAKGETIKFTNDITCTLSDTNSSDGCDTSLWFESENVTMDFNSKKLVVRSNYGGSLNIINAFGAGCISRTVRFLFIERQMEEQCRMDRMDMTLLILVGIRMLLESSSRKEEIV